MTSKTVFPDGGYFSSIERGWTFPHTRSRKITFTILGYFTFLIGLGLIFLLAYLVYVEGMPTAENWNDWISLAAIPFFAGLFWYFSWAYLIRFRNQYLGSVTLDVEGIKLNFTNAQEEWIPWQNVLSGSKSPFSGILSIKTKEEVTKLEVNFPGAKWFLATIEFAVEWNRKVPLQRLTEAGLIDAINDQEIEFRTKKPFDITEIAVARVMIILAPLLLWVGIEAMDSPSDWEAIGLIALGVVLLGGSAHVFWAGGKSGVLSVSLSGLKYDEFRRSNRIERNGYDVPWSNIEEFFFNGKWGIGGFRATDQEDEVLFLNTEIRGFRPLLLFLDSLLRNLSENPNTRK